MIHVDGVRDGCCLDVMKLGLFVLIMEVLFYPNGCSYASMVYCF